MAETAVKMAVGTHLFVASQSEVWQEAIVDKIDGEFITVKLGGSEEGRTLVLKKGDPYYPRSLDLCATESGYPDDLTKLTHLHEASVLHSLECRFMVDDIYTFTGKILVAVNPFKIIEGLYSDETIERFLDEKHPRVPHVFTVAKDAYSRMTIGGKSQTILISGESGAGKTESTKFAMKFLATAGGESLKKRSSVEMKVLDSNPLLESFGNASTVRNSNSSRFGKFVELQYIRDSPVKLRLCGAKIDTYLLEKVRICKQQTGERNYHIFHQLLAAYKESPKYRFPKMERYHGLEEWELNLEYFEGDFRILPPDSDSGLDLELFEDTIAAMQTVGMSKEDVDTVFSVVAAILHLSNIEFVVNRDYSEGAVVNNTPGNNYIKASELLGVDPGSLLNALLCRTIKTTNELYSKPLRVEEACYVRDAIAKNIYSSLFEYIVQRANEAIGCVSDTPLSCGILDIFGFECFQENSFEQLCINFTNETLQNFFNNFVFKCEEELYAREGIPWNSLDFPDNADCIDLFKSRPNGLFIMIDEECHLPGGKDQLLCNKFSQRHCNNKRFGKVKTDQTCFIVNHFAGSVRYKIDGFLEKNKDQLSTDAILFISSTKFKFIKAAFESQAENGAGTDKASPRRRLKTISTQFTGQLDSLMNKISATEPHFIRCIKPNNFALPSKFDRQSVDSQLRYGGMLQVVQVSRAGYPVRLTHAELLKNFRFLLKPEEMQRISECSDLKTRGVMTLKFLVSRYIENTDNTDGYKDIAVGETLIFFKNEPYEQIYNVLQEFRNRNATYIQSVVRAMIKRRWFLAVMRQLRTLQIWIRFKIGMLKKMRIKREAAIVMIQNVYRMHLKRSLLRILSQKVTRIASLWRRENSQATTKQRRINLMTTLIQASWKGYVCRKYYLQLLDATIKAQLRWRAILARRELRSLRMEAKSLGTILKKAQYLQEELKEERTRRTEAEAKVLQLTAKVNNLNQIINDLKSTVESMTVERKGLADKLFEAESSCKKSQEDLRIIKDFLSKEVVHQRSSSNWLTDTSVQSHDSMVSLTNLPVQCGSRLIDSQNVQPQPSQRPQQSIQHQYQPYNQVDGQIRGTKYQERQQKYCAEIVLCGPSKCGKTRLIEMALIKLGDERNLDLLRLQNGANKQHRRFQPHLIEFTLDFGRNITVLEVPGQFSESEDAIHMFRNSCLVAICFDPGNPKSLDECISFTKFLMPLISPRSTTLCLIQNDYYILESDKQMICDIGVVHHFAMENELLYIRVTDMIEFIRQVTPFVDSKRNFRMFVPGRRESEISRQRSLKTQNTRSALTIFYEKFRNFWAGTNYSGDQNKLLQPTLVAPEAYKLPPLCLKRVAQISNYTSAVTCVEFRPEDPGDSYILLAVGRRDGTINLYHCFRTLTEIKVLTDTGFDEHNQCEVDERVSIAESFTLSLHTKAVTCMSFSRANSNELVTSSVDCTIRAWNVANGQLIKVFNDSFPGIAVLFHPAEPSLFISCNSNPTIRVIDYNKGLVLQKIRTKSELRCLTFDDTKFNCIAGSERGAVCVYESQADMHLKLSTTKQISRGPVTCVNFISATSPDSNPCVIANVCSGNITVLNCIYDGKSRKISEFTYRYVVSNNHVALPLRSCISRFGGGWCISGSEDRNLLIFSLLEENMPYSISFHKGPVVAVAVNSLDTVLATSDSKGVVALWRRVILVN